MAGCSEGALCRPGRPQSVHANAQRAAGDRSVWLDAGAVLSRKRPCAGLAISIPDATLRSRSVTPAFKIGSGIKIVAFGNQNCCVVALQPCRRLLVTAVPSVRRSDRLRSVADSAEACQLCELGRFARFSDAQGTSGLRIRVGQRGQDNRTSAARRGSVVAAARISQKHQRLVARGRIGSIEMAYSGGDRSHTKGHA